ncbi:cobaltochelatase subunit CobN [Clostridium sp. MSJ-11]|uniref:Cobaltochelatase subunit CobN n=1 Tax=Clostridium mobile TaxID=2841512 RepID=A0ABS6EMR8_9CLOT|nr:cobaltochelatase subunit CobN [Clostridium mobile]MBU5485936.1 cobaltochelatase subunit CobN [Clostridium mobile]
MEYAQNILNNFEDEASVVEKRIFGTAPEGKKIENLVSVLLKLSNGEVPSIMEGLCKAYNMNYKYMKNNPYERDKDGDTNLMVLNTIEDIGRTIISKLHSLDYREEAIEIILNEYFVGESRDKIEDLVKTLKFATNIVMDNLIKANDETHYVIDEINGEFIPLMV